MLDVQDTLSLIRPDLRQLQGYCSAAKESRGSTYSVKVDANECAWLPFGSVSAQCAVNRYPESQPRALRQRLADIWNVDAEQVLLTAGSDQGIDVLIRLFCRSGVDNILVCPPTFSMYKFYAAVQGCETLQAPLNKRGQLDLDIIRQQTTQNTKLIFIPTPNAPMGTAMNPADLLTLCRMCHGQSVVVADEAYVEYSSNPEGLLPQLDNVPNLVILRTLSKAQALAGERIGGIIADRSLTKIIEKVLPPFPIAQSAIIAGTDALSPCGLVLAERQRQLVIQERERLYIALQNSPFVEKIYKSEGNFLFLQANDIEKTWRLLLKYGVLARRMDAQIDKSVRLSIGSSEENDIILAAFGVQEERRGNLSRSSNVLRQTKETRIEAFVDLDAGPSSGVSTGIAFLNHMLDQLAYHGNFTLFLQAQGDLGVDQHHTVEDCGIALGQVLASALGNKKGIGRFGFTAPLDEALAQVSLDLCGRPFLDVQATWPSQPSDGMPPDLFVHFMRSFTTALGATLHISIKGDNTHHMIESCFKALGRALRQAASQGGSIIPSTKGVL